MDFAVKVRGLDDERAFWVLAVKDDALLLALEEGLQWFPLEDCTLARAQTPDQPRLVMPVPQQPQIAIPSIPNRAMRRNGNT